MLEEYTDGSYEDATGDISPMVSIAIKDMIQSLKEHAFEAKLLLVKLTEQQNEVLSLKHTLKRDKAVTLQVLQRLVKQIKGVETIDINTHDRASDTRNKVWNHSRGANRRVNALAEDLMDMAGLVIPTAAELREASLGDDRIAMIQQ
eukprot:15003643-Ditylum_brightwellii.AAC.1